ncbi:MAG: hypothetical protein IJC78_05320 [Clostridia bacterium]|nr:hypothetical protein [Clostridia bacterium]
MSEYTVKKGKILSKDGLPYAPRWFCDGRLSVQVDERGIGDVHYFGVNSTNFLTLHKCFWGGLKFYSIDQDGRCMIRPQVCEILPFGFESDSDKCVFSIYVANNTIYLSVTPKADMDFGMEFYEKYLFHPDTRKHADIGLKGKAGEWTKPVFENNILSATYTSENKKVSISISSDTALHHETRVKYGKHILLARELKAGQEYVFCVCFADGEPSWKNNYKEDVAAQFKRYEAVAEKAPVLKSPHEKLNQFFSLAPMYHESLKVTEEKGAIRAKTTHYWVWSWDSLTSNACSFYWGDHAFMNDMLDFIYRNSDENGIANEFSYDMNNTGRATSIASDGMYTCLVDMYRISGGDISAYYPAVKEIFERVLAAEVGQTGLCSGSSLYPDFPQLVHETEHSISTFNNTVVYCGVRSAEKIAKSLGDTETEAKAKAFCARAEANFSKILFHEEMGFVDCAADGDTYAHCGVASNNSVKWENPYCEKLMPEQVQKACLDFYEKNLVCKAGIRPYPEWSECFDADANQFHSWWPVMSEFYVRLVNQFDRKDLMEQYVGWLEYWTEKLICPEGIDCYFNEREVPFNNWDALPGIWHGYSIRGFYNAIVHAYIGVDFDETGLHFHPYTGDEVAVSNLHWGEKTFDISIVGSGKNIRNVMLNGESLGSVKTIPYEMLMQHNRIELVRE